MRNMPTDGNKINLVKIPQEQLEKERNSNYEYFSIDEPKTLEEFIKKSYLSRLEDDLSVGFGDGIKLGAKWQEERMYSEEEVIEFTMNMISQYVVGNTNIWDRDRLKESLLLKKL